MVTIIWLFTGSWGWSSAYDVTEGEKYVSKPSSVILQCPCIHQNPAGGEYSLGYETVVKGLYMIQSPSTDSPTFTDRRRRVWGILYWNAWPYGNQVPLQPTRTVSSIPFLNRRERGTRDDSVGQGACHHTWPPKINAWDPRDGRRELSCHQLSSDLHMCSVAHAHVHQVNKDVKKNEESVDMCFASLLAAILSPLNLTKEHLVRSGTHGCQPPEQMLSPCRTEISP